MIPYSIDVTEASMFSFASNAVRNCHLQRSSARCFSDVAHKPLLNLHGLQARYANATYVAASKVGGLETVERELMGLYKSSQKSAAFAAFLENPMISRDEKTKYVASMDKLSPITRNLLITMAGNARLNELPKVATTFSQLMKAKRGEVEAQIISASELSAAELKEVKAAMQSQVPKGKTVIIEAVTDPSIVGGLQVQIGDQFLDLSVKSRIEEIARTPLS
jgi:F-type H+-transporting ATPase subunit O